ncbi:dihydrofolate reductase [Neoaquamicrobium sediminum]|uniref:Dihydrofolate reductase n=1 Tax=Neoaquamicrobium sediminum TaxID=1849104 RepID=A0ABV3WZU2_9HYPH|nr:dihydrofolate reductase [Mesorhizobium sp.]
MKVTLVVAIAENGVIGRDGDLPWRLSTDMKRFKATTMGKPVVMGRKTWESFPKRPLPGRHNIVITRDRAYLAEGADVASSLDEAMQFARADGAAEVAVIGGGQIYAQALPDADRLDVTHVLATVDGDTRFPPIDPQTWYVVSEEAYPAGEKDSHATRHVIYERRQSAQA